MKNLLLLILPLLIAGCKGTEKHRAAIQDLSSRWETTTKELTDFQATVSTDLTNYTQGLAMLQQKDIATMDAQDVTAWEAAQKPVTDAMAAYTPFQRAINDFIMEWDEKSRELTALKDGLEKGKIEGDANAKINELNAMIAKANENLAMWKSSYTTIKGNVSAAMSASKHGTDQMR